MLVESIVRKTLGVKDHRVVNVVAAQGGLEVILEVKRRRRLECSQCGKRCCYRDRLPERTWRHAPLWGMSVILRYRPCRVACSRCGVIVEKIPWTFGKSPLSLGLLHSIATWSRMLSWEVTARLFGVSWNTVASAVRHAVTYGLEHRDTDTVRYIGIDEISRKKGHHYVTNVYDLESKRLLWSGEGRKETTLEAFFETWGEERTANIQGVCCDMWAPYVNAIKTHCPFAVMVFDKFHIVRHLLQAVDEVRKMEHRALMEEAPDLLKGTKYIWLKNPWNLTPRQNLRLKDLLTWNLKISKAYLLKEFFQHLWQYKRRVNAARYLKKWFWWATHSRIKPLRDFAWMLRRHEEGILAYFSLRITNASVEAMNNKAKQVSHRAFGFRTAGTYIDNLYHCMGNLPLPKIVHKFS
jgi:transposase